MAQEVRNVGAYQNLQAQLVKLAKHNRQGSEKTKDRYFQANDRFCRHLADKYNLQNLRNISGKHLESYLQEMRDQGKSASTIKTDLAGIRFFHEKLDNAKYTLPDNAQLGVTERRHPTGNDRSWAPGHFEKMCAQAEQIGRADIKNVLELARYQGARVHEVTRIDRATAERAVKTGQLNLKGKGGKERTVELTPEGRTTLQEAMSRVDRGDKLFVAEDQKTHLAIEQVQGFLSRYSEKGESIHGLRHSWAQERYQELKDQGKSNYAAREQLSTEIGHNRVEVTYVYVPP